MGNEVMEASVEKDRLDVERDEIESMIAGTRKRAYTQIDHQAPAATLPHKVARGLRYVPPPSIIEIKAKKPKFLVTKRKVNGVMVVKVINREDAADVLERWSAEAAADEAIEAAAKAKGIEAAGAKGIEAAADEDMGGEDFDEADGGGEGFAEADGGGEGFDEAAGVGEDIGELNEAAGEVTEEHEADDGAAAEGDGIADDGAPEDYAEGDEPDEEEDIDIGGAGSLENIGVLD